MGIAITEEHEELADVVRQFLSKSDAPQAARLAIDGDPSVLRQTGEEIGRQGWHGMHVPEEYGGEGYGIFELAVVVEELGRTLATGSFTPSVIGSAIILFAGSEELKRAKLPALVAASSLASVGLNASIDIGSSSISGESGPVMGALFADTMILISGEDVLVVDPAAQGVLMTDAPSLDPALGIRTFRLESVARTSVSVIPGAGDLARQLSRTLLASEASGAARAILDRTVDYAKTREQFGRTIGSFQAIKHHLANMLVQCELAVATTWDAARIDPLDPSAAISADSAASSALRALLHNAQLAIQVHGGIGFTWEYDAHLFLRRALVLAALVGPDHNLLDSVYSHVAEGRHRRYAIELPAEVEELRAPIREFRRALEEVPPADRRKLLAESGYLVPDWPEPFGLAASAAHQLVIEEEFAGLDLPQLGIGAWVMLTLLQKGTPDQVARWIGPSLRGEHTWCQMFSEPEAGSDAAAIKTRAAKVEGGWRITGQKVWTSDAQISDRGLVTVRTDNSAAKHKGITAMAVNLTSPGVEIRPIREITGDSLFNEVFFDNVFVADDDVIGEVNNGWSVARATFGNERVSIGSGNSRDALEAHELVTVLAQQHKSPDVFFNRKIAELIVEEHGLKLMALRQAARALETSKQGVEGNLSKLFQAEHVQRVSALGMAFSGADAVVGSETSLSHEYLFARGLTIAGGTSEVARNVVAEQLLGLPRGAVFN